MTRSMLEVWEDELPSRKPTCIPRIVLAILDPIKAMVS